jgi:hypothetical protein
VTVSRVIVDEAPDKLQPDVLVANEGFVTAGVVNAVDNTPGCCACVRVTRKGEPSACVPVTTTPEYTSPPELADESSNSIPDQAPTSTSGEEGLALNTGRFNTSISAW